MNPASYRNLTGLVASLAVATAASACSSKPDASSSRSSSASTSATSSSTSSSGASTGAGGSDAGTIDGGGGAGGSAFETAPHAAFPIIPSNGGPILAHPNIVTISFAGYPFESDVQAFGDWVVTSNWLAATGKDYGVSTGAHVMKVVLQGPAPAIASDADTAMLITNQIAANVLPDPSTLVDPLYVVYYPSGTAVQNFESGPGCDPSNTLGGYHWETAMGSTKIPYAVVPTCDSTDAKALTYVEASAGHEIIEAATDPFPLSDPGYGLVSLTDPWGRSLGAEVADLCQFQSDVTEAGFTVPRVWSNSAAKAGTDPCVPPPATETVYYNVSPSQTKVTSAAAGVKSTITLTGWSSMPIAPWGLQLVIWGDFNLTASLSAKSIQNGEKVTLDLTVPAGTPAGKQGNVLVYSVRDLASGDYNSWPIVVDSK
jgi:hypothetical protein